MRGVLDPGPRLVESTDALERQRGERGNAEVERVARAAGTLVRYGRVDRLARRGPRDLDLLATERLREEGGRNGDDVVQVRVDLAAGSVGAVLCRWGQRTSEREEDFHVRV